MTTPYSTHVYEEVTSTQDVARSLGADSPVLVIAARQTEGRGRSGASWESAPRAVAASLHCMARNWSGERQTLIPLAVGVAVARLYELSLKWPNDLLFNDRKVGGILVEASGAAITIGIGLNLWWPGAPFDRTGLFTEDPGPDCYVPIGSDIGNAIWAELVRGPDDWSHGDYTTACVTLGREITWDGGGSGIAVEVDPRDGSLLVDEGRGLSRLRAGAVRHVR